MTRDPLPLPSFSVREIVFVALAVVFSLWMLGGCATTVGPGQTLSQEKAWKAALTSYEALATGMAVYCGVEPAEPVPCLQAAVASIRVEEVIRDTKADLAAGRATDATLKAAAAALKAAEPALQKVQPAKGVQ